MSEVLVTGANGFVGSHICDMLVKSGFVVRALVRKTSDLTNIKDLPIKLFYGDLSDPASLKGAICGVDIVVNNAGLTKALDINDFERVNTGGTENVLRAIEKNNPGLKRVIQISSTAACGSAPSATPIDENYPPHPLTAYGRSKLNAEKMALSFGDKFNVIILRPSAVYGPRDKEMLTFFKAVKFGIKPTFGQGESYINFTYVKDLAASVVRAVQVDKATTGIYFVLEKRGYSYSEANDIIQEIFGNRAIDINIPSSVLSFAGLVTDKIARLRKKAAVFSEEKALEIAQRYWLFDSSKIERELGFVAPTDFRTGAAETIKWYRKEGWI